MKYLTISHLHDLFFTLSPEMQMQVIEVASAFTDKYRKAGKIKDVYIMVGSRKSMRIWEVESAKEIDRLQLENPMGPFMETEIHALCDYDGHVKACQEVLEPLTKK